MDKRNVDVLMISETNIDGHNFFKSDGNANESVF